MPKLTREMAESCVNKEFALWLWDWYREAQESDSRFQFTMRKALESMIKCEERLKSGRDAVRLPGIGPGISERLQRRLEKHVLSDGFPWHCDAFSAVVNAEFDQEIIKPKLKPKTKTSTGKNYTPKFRSIPFGIVLALHNNPNCDLMTKGEILTACGLYVQTAVQTIELTEKTVNQHISALIKKEIIARTSRNGYELTLLGSQLGQRLNQTFLGFNGGSVLPDLKVKSRENKPDDDVPVKIITDYQLVLLIDVREVRSKDDRRALLDGFSDTVTVESASLSVGDMILVARQKTDQDVVIMEWVVERKTDSDLVASIPDGRYREQKERLERCGAKNVIYLIEGSGNVHSTDSLDQEKRYFAAISQTAFTGNFIVKRTGSVKDTVKFLTRLYEQAKDRLSGKELIVLSDLSIISQYKEKVYAVPFDLYSQATSKSANLTFSDIYRRQLAKIKGVGDEAVLQVSRQYPCHADLALSFQEKTTNQQNMDDDSVLMMERILKKVRSGYTTTTG